MRFRLASILLAAMALPAIGVLQAESFEEGTDYLKLDKPQETSEGEGVEVIEFFSYGCGHCANLEPHLNKWREDGQSENARFVKVPVAWSQGFESLARVYFAADILGVPEEAHEGIFNMIHVDRAQLSLEMIANYFGQHGADPKAFIETFGSAEVTQRVDTAKALTRQYQVTGVPVFVVGGAYKVPSPTGGFPRMLETVNYVVDSVVGKEAG